MTWVYAMLSVAAVSLLSLVGIVFLAADQARLQKILLVHFLAIILGIALMALLVLLD